MRFRLKEWIVNLMKPLIGILGGMGPLATVDLMEKIIEETIASRDQDHVPVVAWNVPQIPDRQQALAATGPSPLPAMLEGITQLNAVGATRIVIACNTAHFWFDALSAASTAPIIHIADATLDVLTQSASHDGPVGLIATRGTLEAGLYQARFEAHGMRTLINTDDEMDTLFTPGCYAIKRGEFDVGGRLLEAAAQRLVDRGATKLVLACTEVPIGLKRIASTLLPIAVDPNRALARACVAYWSQAGHDA
jgi:aspartate racemase